MRLDIWLWAVRFFKSRTQATAACRAGKVHLNNVAAKASSLVKVGDMVSWKDPLRVREVKVEALLPRRVGAPEAVTAYTDLSAPIPPKEERGSVPVRDRGAGRPEKRDRRDLDRLRGFQK